jgi:tRNA dimethylallyltransferase
MIKVLVIAGATATGKSMMAIECANRYDGEIISIDSQQVYQELNIGTAKTLDQQSIQHYGIDLVPYDFPYSVADSQTYARKRIDTIQKKHHLPILVGGTGLYINAILYDYVFNQHTEELNQFEEIESDILYERLKQLDQVSALKIHPNNRKRIIRALQIAESGQLKSVIEDAQNHQYLYDVCMLVLDYPRATLHQRIEERVDEMFKAGLKAEVMKYFSDPNTHHYQSFQAIGYKEWKDYLNQQANLDEVRNQIITHTKQFAKRQVTWFKHQNTALWVDMSNQNSIDSMHTVINEWLNKETL